MIEYNMTRYDYVWLTFCRDFTKPLLLDVLIPEVLEADSPPFGKFEAILGFKAQRALKGLESHGKAWVCFMVF